MSDILLNQEILDSLQDLDISELMDNGRYYFNGNPVPRVTAIISEMSNKEFLIYWALHLAKNNKSFQIEKNIAADIGTVAHKMIENFILQQEDDGEIDGYNLNIRSKGIHCFNAWMTFYNSRIANSDIQIISSEQIEVCQYYGCTIDAIAKDSKGHYKLYDWKTSNKISPDYFIQLAAYKYIMELNHGIIIDELNIIQLPKDTHKTPIPIVYTVNTNDHLEFINNCTNTFLGMLYSYYNRMYINNYFKQNENNLKDVVRINNINL